MWRSHLHDPVGRQNHELMAFGLFVPVLDYTPTPPSQRPFFPGHGVDRIADSVVPGPYPILPE